MILTNASPPPPLPLVQLAIVLFLFLLLLALSAHEHPLNDPGHLQDASSAARLQAEDPNQNREYACAVIRVDVLLLDR